MKNKTITAEIQQFNLIGAVHWWVTFNDNDLRTERFNHYEDARKYALVHAYAKNIIVYD